MHPAVRPAAASDVEQIHAMVLELAAYERAADQVRATPDQLGLALFGSAPTAYALIAEHEGAAAGFALYFLNFSTWEGRAGIYLEDLYVRPGHRGLGLGKALLGALAETAVDQGYVRLDWAVLNWNTPSIDFYRRLGAVAMEEWTTYRLTGSALRAVGAPGNGDRSSEPAVGAG